MTTKCRCLWNRRGLFIRRYINSRRLTERRLNSFRKEVLMMIGFFIVNKLVLLDDFPSIGNCVKGVSKNGSKWKSLPPVECKLCNSAAEVIISDERILSTSRVICRFRTIKTYNDFLRRKGHGYFQGACNRLQNEVLTVTYLQYSYNFSYLHREIH